MNPDINWALSQIAPPSCKHILLVLANRTNGKHECFPSLASIASDTGLNRVTVTRCITQLLTMGLIVRKKRGIQSNVYVLQVVAPRNQTQLHHATTTQPPVVAPRSIGSCTTQPPVVAPRSTEPKIEPKGNPKRGGEAAEVSPPTQIEITEDMRKWAEKNGVTVDLKTETEAMLDHYRGTGENRSDWEAVWRGWMRRSKRFKSSSNGNGRNSGAGAIDRPDPVEHGAHMCPYCTPPHAWLCKDPEICNMKLEVACPVYASKYNTPVVSVGKS